jgi:hypothetical protein
MDQIRNEALTQRQYSKHEAEQNVHCESSHGRNNSLFMLFIVTHGRIPVIRLAINAAKAKGFQTI